MFRIRGSGGEVSRDLMQPGCVDVVSCNKPETGVVGSDYNVYWI